jgi:hypothetical protein
MSTTRLEMTRGLTVPSALASLSSHTRKLLADLELKNVSTAQLHAAARADAPSPLSPLSPLRSTAELLAANQLGASRDQLQARVTIPEIWTIQLAMQQFRSHSLRPSDADLARTRCNAEEVDEDALLEGGVAATRAILARVPGKHLRVMRFYDSEDLAAEEDEEKGKIIYSPSIPIEGMGDDMETPEIAPDRFIPTLAAQSLPSIHGEDAAPELREHAGAASGKDTARGSPAAFTAAAPARPSSPPVRSLTPVPPAPFNPNADGPLGHLCVQPAVIRARRWHDPPGATESGSEAEFSRFLTIADSLRPILEDPLRAHLMLKFYTTQTKNAPQQLKSPRRMTLSQLSLQTFGPKVGRDRSPRGSFAMKAEGNPTLQNGPSRSKVPPAVDSVPARPPSASRSTSPPRVVPLTAEAAVAAGWPLDPNWPFGTQTKNSKSIESFLQQIHLDELVSQAHDAPHPSERSSPIPSRSGSPRLSNANCPTAEEDEVHGLGDIIVTIDSVATSGEQSASGSTSSDFSSAAFEPPFVPFEPFSLTTRNHLSFLLDEKEFKRQFDGIAKRNARGVWLPSPLPKPFATHLSRMKERYLRGMSSKWDLCLPARCTQAVSSALDALENGTVNDSSREIWEPISKPTMERCERVIWPHYSRFSSNVDVANPDFYLGYVDGFAAARFRLLHDWAKQLIAEEIRNRARMLPSLWSQHADLAASLGAAIPNPAVIEITARDCSAMAKILSNSITLPFIKGVLLKIEKEEEAIYEKERARREEMEQSNDSISLAPLPPHNYPHTSFLFWMEANAFKRCPRSDYRKTWATKLLDKYIAGTDSSRSADARGLAMPAAIKRLIAYSCAADPPALAFEAAKEHCFTVLCSYYPLLKFFPTYSAMLQKVDALTVDFLETLNESLRELFLDSYAQTTVQYDSRSSDLLADPFLLLRHPDETGVPAFEDLLTMPGLAYFQDFLEESPHEYQMLLFWLDVQE